MQQAIRIQSFTARYSNAAHCADYYLRLLVSWLLSFFVEMKAAVHQLRMGSV
eukprot:SAG31_NODE_3690_length_3986_cov_1.671984_1_plen_52_part_00